MKTDGLNGEKEVMPSVLMVTDKRHSKLLVPPMLYTRGFNSAEDSHVVRHSQMKAQQCVQELMSRNASYAEIKSSLKDVLSKYIQRKTDRRPMIIPVIMEAR